MLLRLYWMKVSDFCVSPRKSGYPGTISCFIYRHRENSDYPAGTFLFMYMCRYNCIYTDIQTYPINRSRVQAWSRLLQGWIACQSSVASLSRKSNYRSEWREHTYISIFYLSLFISLRQLKHLDWQLLFVNTFFSMLTLWRDSDEEWRWEQILYYHLVTHWYVYIAINIITIQCLIAGRFHGKWAWGTEN